MTSCFHCYHHLVLDFSRCPNFHNFSLIYEESEKKFRYARASNPTCRVASRLTGVLLGPSNSPHWREKQPRSSPRGFVVPAYSGALANWFPPPSRKYLPPPLVVCAIWRQKSSAPAWPDTARPVHGLHLAGAAAITDFSCPQPLPPTAGHSVSRIKHRSTDHSEPWLSVS